MIEKMKFCVVGASFDAGNRGVCALAASVVQCINEVYHNAHIVLLDHGESNSVHYLELNDKIVPIELINTSFSKYIWRSNHYLWVFLLAVLYRLLPWCVLRQKILKKRRCLRAIVRADACFDISAGDSFSDIYGLYSLVYVSSYKLLFFLLRKKLILLPQTYGPLKRPIAKTMARYILKKATKIYSRDQVGVEYVNRLMNTSDITKKVQFSPDVAFVLESHKPHRIDVGLLEQVRNENSVVVGFNISGLLFNGGYTHDNMFGLKDDYNSLITSVLKFFLKNHNVIVLLVPHVFHPPGNVESDSDASMQVYKSMGEEFKGRLFLTRGQYDQSEIKHVIGMCDFFIGSRMHSCIAAMSQNIPTIGLAYSKKFRGVFQSVEVEGNVIDLRHRTNMEALAEIAQIYERRETIAEKLRDNVPEIKKQVLEIFKKTSLPASNS